MIEYVKKSEIAEAISHCRGLIVFNALEFANTIDKLPAADVAPVVHGRWIEGAENFTCGNHNAECSVCGANISWNGCDEDFNYCPNCGAMMDVPNLDTEGGAT